MANDPDRLADADVFRKLKALHDGLVAAGDQNANSNAPRLARELEKTLFDFGLSAQDFYETAQLNDGERSNTHNGHLMPGPLAKLLKAAADLTAAGQRRPIRSEWVSVTSEEGRKLVARVRKPLEDLVEALRRSNEAGEPTSILTKVQKDQLIVLLRALLVELEGSHLDRGRVSVVLKWLGKLVAKEAGKEIAKQGADWLSGGMSSALEGLRELYSWLRGRKATDLPDSVDGATEV